MMKPLMERRPSAPAPAAKTEPEQMRQLSPTEREWKQRIYERLLKILDLSLLGSLEEHAARSQIREITTRLLLEESAPLSLAQRQFVTRRIEDEVMGHGPLEPLLADPTVSDILVNGSRQVYVERHGKLELTEVRFNDDAHLMNIIDRIVSAVGRRVDESSPMVDARLRDGSRVNVIIPPLALDGPMMSIRRFAVELLKADDLIRLGTINEPMAMVLKAIVHGRLNVVISGGTGAGKTTLLNIVSGFVPLTERVVTIEDSAELQLQQPHVVRLETRPPNIEGKGQVAQRDLVRNALRMRPERIIVGEVRGAEALDMLQAMNTGHGGSLATLHANTPREGLTRLETMIMMGGFELPVKAMRQQICSAIDLIIQANRLQGGPRKITSITEVMNMEQDVIIMQEVFRFRQLGIDQNSRAFGQFESTGVRPSFINRLEAKGVKLPSNMFAERILMRD
jgi:pilus assembly protein CpaF